LAPSVMWFRRDLRLRDNPALAAASSEGPVLALFVLDPALLSASGRPRTAFLLRSLTALDLDLRRRGGGLVVRSGNPEEVVPEVAGQVGAGAVHVASDFGPYGSARDKRVETALASIPLSSMPLASMPLASIPLASIPLASIPLASIPLVRSGSPYAVSPGRLLASTRQPFQVYTAFYRAWSQWPVPGPCHVDFDHLDWALLPSEQLPPEPDLPAGFVLPPAGEDAAIAAWQNFRRQGLDEYEQRRDRPDLNGTSRLSAYLKFGSLHPRTLLAGLNPEDQRFRKELAWREFYAHVLHFWPGSARQSFQPRMRSLRWRSGVAAEDHFRAWQLGRTGYPIVDAGMRQLMAEGWVHNRVRMIVASFLVKDLHIDWLRGARHFMSWLVDGDLASNQHGWQWTAGTGTDAAPYYRIFNPVAQGRKFDPEGTYVRRWLPELAELPTEFVHEPWRAAGGVPDGYLARVIDHATERAHSLDAYQALRAGGRPDK
jgi:deoxyribodipyrimidine photo-lyase